MIGIEPAAQVKSLEVQRLNAQKPDSFESLRRPSDRDTRMRYRQTGVSSYLSESGSKIGDRKVVVQWKTSHRAENNLEFEMRSECRAHRGEW
jgi:hypothetical protein